MADDYSYDGFDAADGSSGGDAAGESHDAELSAAPAASVPPSRASRLPMPVTLHSSTPMAPADAAAAAAASTAPAPSAPATGAPSSTNSSPRKLALSNPALARLNKSREHVQVKGLQLTEQQQQRVKAHEAEHGSPSMANTSSGFASASSPGAAGIALSPPSETFSIESIDRLRRELAYTKNKLKEASAQVASLQALREEDQARATKVLRNDRQRLDGHQLANALKKVEIFRKANETLRSQVNAPEKINTLLNKITEGEAAALALQEENKVLKADMRRLTKELEGVTEAAGDAPQRLAAAVEDAKHLRDKLKALQIAKDADDRRARKNQELMVLAEEKNRRNLAIIAELSSKKDSATHHHTTTHPAHSQLHHSDSAAVEFAATSPPSAAVPHAVVPSRPPFGSVAVPSKRKVAPKAPSSSSSSAAPGDTDDSAREKAAEARIAIGLRNGNGNGSASASGSRAASNPKRASGTRLGKIEGLKGGSEDAAPAAAAAAANSNAHAAPVLSPTPPAAPKPKATASSSSSSTAAAATASSNKVSRRVPIGGSAAAAAAKSPDSATAAPVAVAVAAPAPAAKSEFDVDEFLGFNKSSSSSTSTTTATTTAAAETTADPYASKPKHTSDAGSTKPAETVTEPTTTSTDPPLPAWLRPSPTHNTAAAAASPPAVAAAPAQPSPADAFLPSWLKPSPVHSPTAASAAKVEEKQNESAATTTATTSDPADEDQYGDDFD